MIVAKISEQLGNQMLIYATAYSLAKETKQELALFKLECDVFKKKSTFRLDSLLIDRCYLYSHMPVSICLCIFRRIIMRLSKGRFCTNPFYFRDTPRTHYIIEHEYKYNAPIKIDKTKKYNVLSGFWQCPKYFDKYRADILRQFVPSFELSEERKKRIESAKSCNSVALHIRRGDFLENNRCLNLSFYYEAMKIADSKLSSPVYFIFSDDIGWVKENLDMGNRCCVFISPTETTEPFDDIWLMSKCKHNIIANSTYSWWGAYLNTNPNKTVIVPENIKKTNNLDFVPDNWTMLKY